jgi:hypothetical protein
MKVPDLLQLIVNTGPMAPDGKNGYQVAGKPVPHGTAHLAIASGFTVYDQDAGGHLITEKGQRKLEAA